MTRDFRPGHLPGTTLAFDTVVRQSPAGADLAGPAVLVLIHQSCTRCAHAVDQTAYGPILGPRAQVLVEPHPGPTDGRWSTGGPAVVVLDRWCAAQSAWPARDHEFPPAAALARELDFLDLMPDECGRQHERSDRS